MIVILQCCGKKLDHPAPAVELYQSDLFKKSLAWARTQVKDSRIYILSALYGLVPARKVIAPYNSVLKGSNAGAGEGVDIIDPAAWSYRVAMELAALSKKDPDLVYLAGQSYLKYLPKGRAPWGVTKLPIGKRLAWLKAHTP